MVRPMTTTMKSRRDVLRLGAGAAGAAAAFCVVRPAAAEPAPMSKAAVGYQDVPNNGQVCAACIYFMFAPQTGSAPASRCQLVAGPIAPAGWCEVWQPKG
jgi:hypothetical protein